MSSKRKLAGAHGMQRAKKSARNNYDLTENPIATIINSLESITFNGSQYAGETIKAFAETVKAGIRPGDGLRGTAAEEDDLYRIIREEAAAREEAEEEIESQQINIEIEAAQQEDQIDSLDLGDDKLEIKDEAELYDKKMVRLYNGAYQPEPYGHAYVEMPNGGIMGLWEYLGPSWDRRIEKLYAVPPVEEPPNMAIHPRDFQLKIAAQALHCLDGPMKLFLNGSEMGVGKTLSSILVMWAKKDEPGVSVVVAPKSICKTWLNTIHAAWKQGHGLRAFIVDDSSLTAADIIAGGYDILIFSFEFFEANGRRMHQFHDKIEAATNKQKQAERQGRLKRPTSCLHSPVWKWLEMPFKIAVIDECQRISRTGKTRHEAILNHLNPNAWLMLSGTLPHNKWHAFGGYIVFGKEQPFDTFNKFLHAFSSFDANGTMANPREDKTRLLQKFLQAFTICHPASILNLQECQMMRVRFRLLPDEAVQTSDLTSRYEKAAAIDSSKRQTDGADGSIAVLGLAVKAKMSSLHPILGDLAQSGWVRLFEDLGLVQLDDIEDDIIGESISGHERDKWLQSIRQEPDLITNSGRLQILIRLLNHIRTTYEGEKTVIFADSLRFLDIVAEQIRRTFGVECLRFDGTVPGHKREEIEEKFAAGGWDVPMVITTTSGGVGLNLQMGSVVIMAEHQWNFNQTLQAIARCHRSGQEKQVKAFILHAINGDCDDMIVRVQMRKVRYNRDLMKPLIRLPDEPPAKVELLTFPGPSPFADGRGR